MKKTATRIKTWACINFGLCPLPPCLIWKEEREPQKHQKSDSRLGVHLPLFCPILWKIHGRELYYAVMPLSLDFSPLLTNTTPVQKSTTYFFFPPFKSSLTRRRGKMSYNQPRLRQYYHTCYFSPYQFHALS